MSTENKEVEANFDVPDVSCDLRLQPPLNALTPPEVLLFYFSRRLEDLIKTDPLIFPSTSLLTNPLISISPSSSPISPIPRFLQRTSFLPKASMVKLL